MDHLGTKRCLGVSDGFFGRGDPRSQQVSSGANGADRPCGCLLPGGRQRQLALITVAKLGCAELPIQFGVSFGQLGSDEFMFAG